jgi:dTDP-4-amino-4,6-dideoxygalactose transaminase
MTSPAASHARKVPIINLAKEYDSLRVDLQAAVERVLASGSFILGPETEGLEADLRAYMGVRHAVGVNSGTDALLLAYRALGVGPGDEVIVPAMTFIATAEPVSLLGATPVFADIDPVTYTLDPASVRKFITPRTKAIAVVHLYGQMANMADFVALSKETQIPLVEDMAQSIGAQFQGRKCGTFGTIACLSFFPTKNLGACGDAGAILTNSDELAIRLRQLRNHGQTQKYQHAEVAYNTRLDEIQAAVLRVKLPKLDLWNDARRLYAAEYDRLLAGLPVTLPVQAPGRRHVYHLYCLRTPKRDALRQHLDARGVATGLHYPQPLHVQEAFKDLGGKMGEFPHSERLAAETLSLPLYPQLTMEDVQYVAEQVRAFYEEKA